MDLLGKSRSHQKTQDKVSVSSSRYSGSPKGSMTEMTQFSELSTSRSMKSPRLASSGASITSHLTSHSHQSSYSSRTAEKGWVQDINKHKLMAKHLYRNCKNNNWLEEKANDAAIALRTFQGGYILYPQDDPEGRFKKAVMGLNVEVSFGINYADSRSVFASTLTSSKSS